MDTRLRQEEKDTPKYRGIICWDFDCTIGLQHSFSVVGENPDLIQNGAILSWIPDPKMIKLVMLVLAELGFHSVLATQRILMPLVSPENAHRLTHTLNLLDENFGKERTFLTEQDVKRTQEEYTNLPGDNKNKEIGSSKFYLLEAIKNVFGCDSKEIYLVDDDIGFKTDLDKKNPEHNTSYQFFHIKEKRVEKNYPLGSERDRTLWTNLLEKITKDHGIERKTLQDAIQKVAEKHGLQTEAKALQEILSPQKEKVNSQAASQANPSDSYLTRALDFTKKIGDGIKKHKKPILWALAGILLVGVTIATWGIGTAIAAGTIGSVTSAGSFAAAAGSIATAAGTAFPTLGALITGGALTGAAATGVTIGATITVGSLLQFPIKGAGWVLGKIKECFSCPRKVGPDDESPTPTIEPVTTEPATTKVHEGNTTNVLRRMKTQLLLETPEEKAANEAAALLAEAERATASAQQAQTAPITIPGSETRAENEATALLDSASTPAVDEIPVARSPSPG